MSMFGRLIPSYFYIPRIDSRRENVLTPPRGWRLFTPSPGFENVNASDLSSLAPSPGTVITLAGGTHVLTFNEEFSGWRGTRENPIWLIGDNTTVITNKALECFDHRWVNFINIRSGPTVGTNIPCWNIQQCQDCTWNWIWADGATGNNIQVWGTPTNPNSRLRFFNIDSRNAGVDNFTIHADGSGYRNGNYFLIKNWHCENGVDSGMDITGGDHVYLFNGRSVNNDFEISHGCRNVYVDGHISEDISSRILIKNTDLDLVLANCDGVGELDFGVNASQQAFEEPNRLTGLYNTGRAKIYKVTVPIDNNTGTILIRLKDNPINYLRYSGFRN